MAGDAIGTYGRGFGLPLDETNSSPRSRWQRCCIGYLVGLVAIPQFHLAGTISGRLGRLGILFSFAALVTQGYVSVGFVAALGFANAMMWPAIFPLAIRGLGRYTELGSALLIMGIAGGADHSAALRASEGSLRFPVRVLRDDGARYLYIFYYAVSGA